MSNKLKLSVALASFNEEQFIKPCLDAIKDIADEIIVYDAQSSDKTVSIIKKYPQAKIISGPNHPLFHINKQTAIDACQGEWILQLDPDEVVTPKLKKEIVNTLNHSQYDGYWINRTNYFLGRFLKKGGAYPDPTIRLYKNGKGRLPCKDVHEQAEIKGTVGHLKNDLQHFSDPTFFRYMSRSNRYTSIEAQLLADKHQHLSLFDYFFIKPLYRFIQIYFRHLGLVDGFPGFVYAFYSALRFPAVYVKHYELTVLKGNLNDFQ